MTMWGTDGVRVFTVDDGWGWIFTAVEHWNAECVGWHVSNRFAALQPTMGLAGLYGDPCGWKVSATTSPTRSSIQPSYAFVAEPRPTASPSGSIAR